MHKNYCCQGHFDGFNGSKRNWTLLSSLEKESDIQDYLKSYKRGLAERKTESRKKEANTLKNNYYIRQGWLDGYFGHMNNPLRLGNLTPKDTEDYQKGWTKGREDLAESQAYSLRRADLYKENER